MCENFVAVELQNSSNSERKIEKQRNDNKRRFKIKNFTLFLSAVLIRNFPEATLGQNIM